MYRGFLALVIWLACAPHAAGQSAAADPAGFRILETLQQCSATPAGEIVVCGRRRSQDRYRLTLPGGSNRVGDARPPGEVPRASADVADARPCGIFQGQRRCSIPEMGEAGYGQGRNPIAFIGALVTRLADPDADIRPPPPLP